MNIENGKFEAKPSKKSPQASNIPSTSIEFQEMPLTKKEERHLATIADITERIVKLKSEELIGSIHTSDTHTDNSEEFNSRVGTITHILRINKEHPLIPVLEYAKATYPSDSIELSLKFLFNQVYTKGTLPPHLPSNIKEIIQSLLFATKGSDSQKMNFGKAALNLCYNLGESRQDIPLGNTLKQFEDDIISSR